MWILRAGLAAQERLGKTSCSWGPGSHSSGCNSISQPAETQQWLLSQESKQTSTPAGAGPITSSMPVERKYSTIKKVGKITLVWVLRVFMTDEENCGQLKQQCNKEKQPSGSMPGCSSLSLEGDRGLRARQWERTSFLITNSQNNKEFGEECGRGSN